MNGRAIVATTIAAALAVITDFAGADIAQAESTIERTNAMPFVKERMPTRKQRNNIALSI